MLLLSAIPILQVSSLEYKVCNRFITSPSRFAFLAMLWLLRGLILGALVTNTASSANEAHLRDACNVSSPPQKRESLLPKFATHLEDFRPVLCPEDMTAMDRAMLKGTYKISTLQNI
jgi:hypothetical protein